VDRADDDYTRVVALNVPRQRPAQHDDGRRYAQRRVDVLDLAANRPISLPFERVLAESKALPVHVFASRERTGGAPASEAPLVLQFEELLSGTGFVADLRTILSTLESAYAHPVDLEFTANFQDAQDYSIDVVQCRPFQVRGRPGSVDLPAAVPEERLLLRTQGPIIGHSRVTTIDRVIYVVPQAYAALSMQHRAAVARLVGRLAHLAPEGETLLLLGPGRWGTTTPALGVPVTISDIDTVSVLCEIPEMHPGLVPDVSLGTHFFNDIVELDMLYMAVDPRAPGGALNGALLSAALNSLTAIVPDAAAMSEVVRVVEVPRQPGWKRCCLHADAMAQRGVCYVERD
jgi:hypothetical protein